MENNEEKKVEEKQEEAQQVVVESPTEAITTNENMKMEPVQEGGTEEVKPKKKGKGLIIVIILLLIIAIATSIVYILFFSKTETKKVDNTTKEVKSEYRMTGNNIQNFDLYFAKIENKEANVVYSPLSIKYALEMLSEGADENTKAEIDAVIGEYTAKKYENNEHMSFANAMFIRDTFKEKVNADYKDILSNKYNAELIYDSFASAKPMNDWISNKTFNLLNNILSDDVVKEEDFELVNALAIDMNWKNRLQSAASELPEGMSQMNYYVSYYHENFSDSIEMIEDDNEYPAMKFNGKDNIKSVEVGAAFNRYDIIKDKGEDNIRKTVKEHYEKYLSAHPDEKDVCPAVDEYVDQYITDIGSNYKQKALSTDFYINDTENEKVFAKDLQTYGNTTLQYVGIMPKKDKLTDYIKNVDAKKLTNIVKNLTEVKYENFEEGTITHIKGNIPLFKYDYALNLIEDLQKLGIKDVFDINKANLSKMIKDEKEAISSANHKATIEFSNDGIKAAAVTTMGGKGAASGPCGYFGNEYTYEVPIKEIDINFDKPYLYIIRDKNSGEVWFVGTVYEPIQK